MQLFASLHKPSGFYLPGQHRSNTWVEPVDHHPPRLFTNARYAKMALSWYLKGRASTDFYTDWESGYTEEAGIHIEYQPNRKPEDFEVVEVFLTKEPS